MHLFTEEVNKIQYKQEEERAECLEGGGVKCAEGVFADKAGDLIQEVAGDIRAEDGQNTVGKAEEDEEDEEGGCRLPHEGEYVDNGIKFLRDNIKKIKIKRTGSRQRDMRVDFIESYIGKPEMFIKKYIVCPAFYRDVNNDKGKVSLGAINELYRSLLISVRALRESSE